MKYVATLILLVFSGLLLVGFTTMPENHAGHSNCVISSIASACSSSEQNMALHHVGAYNSFINILITSLVLVAAVLIFFCVIFFEFNKPLLAPAAFENNFSPPQKRRLEHWLSLFINSPSFN